MLTPAPTECMRAREAASARLDGEASELDTARLDAHLVACPACRAYSAAIVGIAAEIRAAPLEQPRVLHHGAEVATVSRRHRMPVVAAAAAVLVAGVAGSSFAVGRLVGAHVAPNQTSTVATDSTRVHRAIAQQRVIAMLNGLELPQPRRSGRMRLL